MVGAQSLRGEIGARKGSAIIEVSTYFSKRLGNRWQRGVFLTAVLLITGRGWPRIGGSRTYECFESCLRRSFIKERFTAKAFGDMVEFGNSG